MSERTSENTARGASHCACTQVFNDVWATADGVSWTQVTPAAGWAPRAYHVSVIVNNGSDIIVAGGGHCNATFVISLCLSYQFYNDVWSSPDGGRTWKMLVRPRGLRWRRGVACCVCVCVCGVCVCGCVLCVRASASVRVRMRVIVLARVGVCGVWVCA